MKYNNTDIAYKKVWCTIATYDYKNIIFLLVLHTCMYVCMYVSISILCSVYF